MNSGALFMVDGAVLGVAAGFSPGPLLALVITQSLRYGTREGLKVAFVPLLTDSPSILLSVLALSSVSSVSPLLGLLTLAGACFVLYLAYDSLRAITPHGQTELAAPQSILRGVLVNMLSPHPFLFWLTVGAPIAVRAWHTNPWDAFVFIATFYVGLVGAKIVVAITTVRSRTLLAGRGYIFLMRTLALLLAIFGCRLLWEGALLLLT